MLPKISQPIENVLLLKFSSQKDLTLTMFRIQEYYESKYRNIQNKHFTIEEFLEAYVTKKGKLNFFKDWEGFNIPGCIYNKWKIIAKTKRETILDKMIKDNLDLNKPFYVIAALKKDKETIRHEIAHALFYMNPNYMSQAKTMVESLPKKQFKKIAKHLKILGYTEKVTVDEIHAYLTTSDKNYLIKEFGVNYSKIKPIVKSLRKLLINLL